MLKDVAQLYPLAVIQGCISGRYRHSLFGLTQPRADLIGVLARLPPVVGLSFSKPVPPS